MNNCLTLPSNRLFWCGIGIGFLLFGCNTFVSSTHLVKSRSQLGQHWILKGKIGCRTDVKSASLPFSWKQTAARYQAHFSGPLGYGRISLAGDNQGFQLIDHQGNQYNNQDAEAYLDALGGIKMPISSMPHWLRALPNPTLVSEKLTETSFLQAGWQLSYLSVKAGDLPKRLDMSNQPVVCRIAIFNWQSLDES